jgi:short-subunit dehydrogenase
MNNRFGVITGASSGIGYELAAICAREGFDLLIALIGRRSMRPRRAFERSAPESMRSNSISPTWAPLSGCTLKQRDAR